MKNFKLKLSAFDIAMIATFTVIALIGAGVWWYLSGLLSSAQDQDKAVAGDYTKFSVNNGTIVSQGNARALQGNSDLFRDQVNPLIGSYLLGKDNGLHLIAKEDPVAWKHDLDEDVHTLITEAKAHGVDLPAKDFYFGFRRYLTENPGDEATAVLSKQRLGIKTLSEILINAPVKAIAKVRRTYEEDPRPANGRDQASPGTGADGDQIGGWSTTVPGGYYTAYPFEVDFDATPESLRPVLDSLVKSPYVFIVRSIEVHNDKTASPTTDDLAKIAGGPAGGGGTQTVTDSAPGAVAASTPALGPQYLFGYSLVHVKMKVDMIEWNPAFATVDSGTLTKKVMKKHAEPVILLVALLLLALGTAMLAYFYPSVADITTIPPLAAQGQNAQPLKSDDVVASLAAWGAPALWDEPTNHHRLFSSDKYLFYPSAFLQDMNSQYIVKVTPESKSPSGVLLRWYDEHHLDFTDANIDHEDPDNDGFSNITEYKNEPVGVRYDAKDVDPAKSTDPNDPKSHPEYLSRLRLQKFETQPFRIKFFGYEQLNGVYLFQLQLSDVPSYLQPPLKKSGDPLGFGGYVVGAFHNEFKDIVDPNTHENVHTDVSTLELDQPDTGEKVILPFRKEINSPAVTADFVMLMPADRDKVIRVLVGKTFAISYLPGILFLAVSADDKGAAVKDLKNNKTYSILNLLDKEWDEVPQAPASNQP